MRRLCASVAATMPISGMSTLRPDKGARQLPPSREETFQASFEDVQAHARQHPARSQGAPTSVPGRRRRRGQLAVGGDPAAEGDVVQGVLLLVALLPRRRPDDEDGEQLLFVDGATRLTGRTL